MSTHTIKEPVTSSKAAPVTAPLSQAIKSNGLLFLSGTCPVDPQGNLVGITEKDVVKQTHQVLQNITGLLEDCGSSMAKVLKVNVFIKDMNDFKVSRPQANSYLRPGGSTTFGLFSRNRMYCCSVA